MSAVSLVGMTNLYLPAMPWIIGAGLPTFNDTTPAAAGSYVHMCGHVWLADRGAGGTRTISSAGGKIHWLTGAVTFGQSGTTLKVGIQDVSTSGPAVRGDGVFDVSKDLVGGTDTINATSWQTTSMASGTKTLTHGDKIAVVIGMSARQASDSVAVRGAMGIIQGATAREFGLPAVTQEVSGPTFTARTQIPICVIEFNDGTLGYLFGTFVTSTAAIATAQSVNTGSTPDEYALIFRVNAPIAIDGIWALLNPSTSAADVELILYSTPLGTPSAVETLTIDANQVSVVAGARSYFVPFTQVRALLANTDYALAIRPSTATGVSLYTFDVNAAAHWGAHSLGTNAYLATRSNQSGAFSQASSGTQRLYIAANVCQLDDGVSTGGGLRIAGHGGLAA